MTRWITILALIGTAWLLPLPSAAAPATTLGDPVYCPPGGGLWLNEESQCFEDCEHEVNLSPTIPSIDCYGCEYNLSWTFTCAGVTYATTITNPIELFCDEDGGRYRIICPLDDEWYFVVQPQCGSCPE